MHKFIIFGFVGACSGSGAKPAPPIDNRGGTGSAEQPLPKDTVAIRACNATTYDFVDFQYGGPDAPSAPLAAGKCTPYQQVDHTVYGYTFVGFSVAGNRFEIVPIDYIGEKQLEPGRWSYMVAITDYAKQVADIRAQRD